MQTYSAHKCTWILRFLLVTEQGNFARVQPVLPSAVIERSFQNEWNLLEVKRSSVFPSMCSWFAEWRATFCHIHFCGALSSENGTCPHQQHAQELEDLFRGWSMLMYVNHVELNCWLAARDALKSTTQKSGIHHASWYILQYNGSTHYSWVSKCENDMLGRSLGAHLWKHEG